jgi:hypothetical protein
MGNMPQLMQMQSMQQQNQLNQMTMQEKQRGQQEMNALRGLMSSPGFDLSTTKSQRDVYNVAPTQAESLIKGYMGNVKTGAEVKNLGFTGQETQAKLAQEKQKHLAQMYRDISGNPSDANITAHAEDVAASSLYTPEDKAAVNARAQRLLAMSIADRTAMLSQQGATAGELRPQVVTPGASLVAPGANKPYFTAPKETPTYAPSADQQGYETARSEGYTGNFLEYKKALAQASRTPAQARAEPTPVAVLDPITKKPILVRPERAVKEGLTPANMAEKVMTPLQKQAFKKDFANDTSKVQSATSTADELEKLTDELVGNPDKKIEPHPGLGGITGYLGILPSLPKGEAAKAEQKLETFKGKIKALGRAIASQEGKLGNMAVAEWQMVSDAVQNISPRAGNLDVQMRDVVRQARDLARNMKEKFDLTYEDTAPATAPKEVAFGSLK